MSVLPLVVVFEVGCGGFWWMSVRVLGIPVPVRAGGKECFFEGFVSVQGSALHHLRQGVLVF